MASTHIRTGTVAQTNSVTVFSDAVFQKSVSVLSRSAGVVDTVGFDDIQVIPLLIIG